MHHKPKPLFSTTTVKGALLAISGTVLLTFAQTSAKILSRHYPQHKEDIADCLDFVNSVGFLLGFGGSIGAIAGRAAATSPTYTPPWLPGANRENFIEDGNNSEDLKDSRDGFS